MSQSIGSRPVAIAAAALFVLGAAVIAAVPAGAAAAPRTVTVYSVVKSQQYVSNADDRERGAANNPFAVDTSAKGNDSQKSTTGPFPGDAAISFNQLYSGPDLLKVAGSASTSCDFVFQRNAICKMTVQLAAGALVLSGPTLYGGRSFSLAVTGGTGKYRSARGELRVTPASGTGAQVAQKFTFVLD